MKKIVLTGSFAFLAVCNIYAAKLQISQSDSEAIYTRGDRVDYTIELIDDENLIAPTAQLEYIYADDSGKKISKTYSFNEDNRVVTSESLDDAGFILIKTKLIDESGAPILDETDHEIIAHVGSGFSPELLQAYEEPEDFDQFWIDQKARLAEVPLKYTLTPVPASKKFEGKIEVFDVKVDCVNGTPVSGYMAKPANAKPKSLPAWVSYQGYGVSSAYAPESAAANYGCLAMNINAHGINNGENAQYYAKLANKLGPYHLTGIESPETSYFADMILRVVRSLEFIKAQPEWNGEILITSGGSQGGLQAVAGAALDSDVTFCSSAAQWLSNTNAVKQNKMTPRWPNNFDGVTDLDKQWLSTIRYYDSANFAKRIKCKVFFTTGLIDDVCLAAGIHAAYNGVQHSDKKISNFINESHHGPTLYYNVDDAVKEYVSRED